MILVTVGSAPHDFSRLIKAIDELGPKYSDRIVMQIGFSTYRPVNAEWFDFVPYSEMVKLYREASLVVGHASAGPILYSQLYSKPLVLFPRRGDLNEHIDNHQMLFVKVLEGKSEMLKVAYDPGELESAISQSIKSNGDFGSTAKPEMNPVSQYITNYLDSLKIYGIRDIPFILKLFRLIKQWMIQIGCYSFFSQMWNRTLWTLKKGYQPKDFWNNWSRVYLKQQSRHTIGASHRWLVSKLNQLGPGRILEAGCASGGTLEYLASNLSDKWHFTGLDLGETMLERARLRNIPAQRVDWICGDIRKLPFEDKAFDIVFTRGTLMHCPKEELIQAISELKRVCKDRLYIIEETHWDASDRELESRSLNPFTFLYNYKKWLQTLNIEILEEKVLEEASVLLMGLECRP